MDHSNTVATVLALFLILWTIVSTKSNHTNALPAILHNAAWAGGLLIVGSGLMRYAPMSSSAWLLIASGLFCFNSGVAIAGTRPPTHRSLVSPIAKVGFLVTRRMYRMLLLGFTIGFVVYLYSIASTFGLSTLFLDPTAIRGDFDAGYLEAFPLYGKLLFYLGPVCFILTLFPGFVQNLGKRPVALRIVIMVYLASAQLATLQRANLFVSLVWAAGMLVLRLNNNESNGRSTRTDPKKVVSLIVGVTIGLVAFQGIAIVLGKTGGANSAASSLVDPRLSEYSLTGVFHYASSGIPAFGKLVDSQNPDWPPPSSRAQVYGDYNPQTWGAATFIGPLKLVPGAPHWNPASAYVFLPVPTNVYSWLEPWYRDFRWPGVLFGSFTIGIIIGRLAQPRQQRPETMLMAGLLVGFSALATFSNLYMSVTAVVLYTTLWLLGKLRRAREISDSKLYVGHASKTRLDVL